MAFEHTTKFENGLPQQREEGEADRTVPLR